MIKDVIQSTPHEPAVQEFVLKGSDICQDIQRKLGINVTLGFLSSRQ